jgi:hypothetical protein
MIAASVLCLAALACSSKNAASTNPHFSFGGTVRSTQTGDKPNPQPTKAPTGFIGSITVDADQAPSGCDNPVKVFWTSSTTLKGDSSAMVGKRIDVSGTQFPSCVLIAQTVDVSSTAGAPASGSGSGTPGSSASPGTLPSASPHVTKGPGPEGAIYDQTPSVPPATQK